MKLSMMTLGCPDWDLVTVIRRAAEYRYHGVDFRGIAGELDVTKLPAFTSDVAATRRMLADHGLEASGISSGISVCDPAKLDANIDEARRTIDTALAIGAENVRVFGNGHPDQIGYADAARHGADCVRTILDLPDARKLKWNFETHDYWIAREHCRLLLDSVADPAFGVTWDMGHTRRIAHETPSETLAAYSDRVRYVHVKDAVHEPNHPQAMKDGWRFVLPGRGELGLAEAFAALVTSGYDGWVMFEHEKRWHRELEEPEVAFPAFIDWINPLLARAGTRH